MPIGEAAIARQSGATSTPTAASPMASPARMFQPSRSPSIGTASKDAQSGMVKARMAARPDARKLTPKAAQTCHKVTLNSAMTRSGPSSRRGTPSGSRPSRQIAIMPRPAKTRRSALKVSGGSSSTASFTADQFSPQITVMATSKARPCGRVTWPPRRRPGAAATASLTVCRRAARRDAAARPGARPAA